MLPLRQPGRTPGAWLGHLALVVLLGGCSSTPDATSALDASGRADAPRPDGAPDQGLAPDAATDLAPDAFSALAGVGTLSGQCGVLDEAVWADDGPALFRNALDFGAGYSFDPDDLSAGGQEIDADGNLGGSSLHSEIFAFEVLRRCELAELLKTEVEIVYLDPGGKKTDLLLTIDGRRVGVSVTRAVGFPRDAPYPPAEASALLEKKLADLPRSAANAAAADRWQRSLLAVLAYGPEHADALQQAFAALDPAVRGDALVVITVTDGDDEFIY